MGRTEDKEVAGKEVADRLHRDLQQESEIWIDIQAFLERREHERREQKE